MSKPAGNCPNCGAPIVFQFSSAVQTTCPFCHSILVRHDLNLEKVGEAADLPPDPSPIQIRTEGIYRKESFVVLGRIVYGYEQGTWNEWHCVTHQGESIWLSDAMAQYAVTSLLANPPEIPGAGHLYTGKHLDLDGVRYTFTSINHARYLGVEGELPFEYWDKVELVFADLRTSDARFATIDYSEDPPLVFTGESVDFDTLRLKNLREFEGW
jgi:hypothetical protein